MRHDDLAVVAAVSRLAGPSAAQIQQGDGPSVQATASDHRDAFFILNQGTRTQAKTHAMSEREERGHIKAKVTTQRAFAALPADSDD